MKAPPSQVQLGDKIFVPYLSEQEIQDRVTAMGHELATRFYPHQQQQQPHTNGHAPTTNGNQPDHHQEEQQETVGAPSSVVFVILLKGAMMFAMDLIRAYSNAIRCHDMDTTTTHQPPPPECRISVLRTQSYQGMESTQKVQVLLQPEPSELKAAHVVVVEDIVDTGHTMHAVVPLLEGHGPRSLTVCTLLHKPSMTLHPAPPLHVIGFCIPNYFVVGYGLDYNGLGRELPSLYQYLPAPQEEKEKEKPCKESTS